MAAFYGIVIEGGSSGPITIRPDGVNMSQIRIVCNAAVLAGGYTTGMRVVAIKISPQGSMPFVCAVVQ